MNLRPRFTLLTLVLFLTAAIPGWFAVRGLAEDIVEQWAVRYAEQQVQHDKARALQPILREVALAQQMANSPATREWARNPDDADKAARALAEFGAFRLAFQHNNYFVALRSNGHYYYNNATDEFAGRELRYVLDPQSPKDAWFFKLIRGERDIHINVNPDPELGVTKLWIDVLIRDGGEVLGIAGTGLDLASFLREVVEPDAKGVSTLFVDIDGAIQLHRNQSMIDFASISKPKAERKTLALLFDRAEDRASVAAAMKQLVARGGDEPLTRFVTIEGRRHLAGIAFVPEIDWFEITLLDLEVLLPLSQFSNLMLVYALSVGALLLGFNIALRSLVIAPLARVDAAVDQLAAGKALPAGLVESAGSGEFRRLMRHFAGMATAVLDARRDLEDKVRERTLALERLARIDPLCEIFNRRGMSERLAAELTRVNAAGERLGILWIDLDYFKEINDVHGHATGDEVLRTVAAMIQRTIGADAVAARWGGDEFLVLVSPIDQHGLDQLGEHVRATIAACRTVTDAGAQPLALSASVGGQLSQPGMGLDALLRAGDESLYAAKAAGRNAYRSIPDA